MPGPRLALAVIGDEIGPSLPEMLSFCAEQKVRRLDMRTVDGRNLLGMTLDEVHAIKAVLDKADRKSTRLNSSHVALSRMPSSA